MKTTFKVMGIIAIVLGGVTILSSFTETDGAGAALVGGLLFLSYGIIMVIGAKQIT